MELKHFKLFTNIDFILMCRYFFFIKLIDINRVINPINYMQDQFSLYADGYGIFHLIKNEFIKIVQIVKIYITMMLVIHVLTCLWMKSSQFVFLTEVNEFIIFFNQFFKEAKGYIWIENHSDNQTSQQLMSDQKIHQYIDNFNNEILHIYAYQFYLFLLTMS